MRFHDVRIQGAADATRREPHECEAADCRRTTRLGKPFCSEHVDLHPYVGAVLRALHQQEQELERVRRRGAAAVDLAGMTADEVRGLLAATGGRTVRGLSRALGLEPAVVRAYVQALSKAGCVRVEQGQRTTRVLPTCPHPQAA